MFVANLVFLCRSNYHTIFSPVLFVLTVFVPLYGFIWIIDYFGDQSVRYTAEMIMVNHIYYLLILLCAYPVLAYEHFSRLLSYRMYPNVVEYVVWLKKKGLAEEEKYFEKNLLKKFVESQNPFSKALESLKAIKNTEKGSLEEIDKLAE